MTNNQCFSPSKLGVQGELTLKHGLSFKTLEHATTLLFSFLALTRHNLHRG